MFLIVICYTLYAVGKPTIIYQQPPKIPEPQITQRDLHLLHALHTHCYLTTPQIQLLFWPATKGIGGTVGLLKACQERLRRLTAHGYIRRIMPFIRQGDGRLPYIYSLDKRGAQRLAEEMGITISAVPYQPKNAENNPSYLRHFLTMNEVRLALIVACNKNSISLVEWISDKELKATGMKEYVILTSPKGTTQKAAVVPDACFTLRKNHNRALFFLELDLGTVTISPSLWERRGWMRKIQAYQAYLASDAFKKRYGTQDAQVLTITTTDERRVHLQEATEKVEVGMDFWFTTLEQATDPDKLLTHPIWQRIGSDQRFSLLG
jgi:hypothetical protein